MARILLARSLPDSAGFGDPAARDHGRHGLLQGGLLSRLHGPMGRARDLAGQYFVLAGRERPAQGGRQHDSEQLLHGAHRQHARLRVPIGRVVRVCQRLLLLQHQLGQHLRGRGQLPWLWHVPRCLHQRQRRGRLSAVHRDLRLHRRCLLLRHRLGQHLRERGELVRLRLLFRGTGWAYGGAAASMTDSRGGAVVSSSPQSAEAVSR